MLEQAVATTTVNTMHGMCQPCLTPGAATRTLFPRIAQNRGAKSTNTFVYSALVVSPA
jgi:hypothetical protein